MFLNPKHIGFLISHFFSVLILMEPTLFILETKVAYFSCKILLIFTVKSLIDFIESITKNDHKKAPLLVDSNAGERSLKHLAI